MGHAWMKIYLAGPDVFLLDGIEIGRRKAGRKVLN
jgi:nucleoside 2-deoxyribosyltransferase